MCGCKDKIGPHPNMFVSELCCCNFRGIIRTLTGTIQNNRLGCSYLKNAEVFRLKVNTRNSLKSAWICTTVRQFSYVAQNSTLSTGSGGERLRSGTLHSSLQKALGHIPAITENHINGIFSHFVWVLCKILDFCAVLLRAIQLTCVFMPLIVVYPLTFISVRLRSLWYKLLLFDLEFAGPIFVKLGQWASTRRDLFPEELCSCLAKLQRRTTAHSWFYTTRSLERAFGPYWKCIFVKFDNNKEPVGSGCCAQVYKAWIDPNALTAYGGPGRSNEDSTDCLLVEGLEMLGVGKLMEISNQKRDEVAESLTVGLNEEKWGNSTKKELIPVAVKVRHPRMEALLRRDLCIMKVVASAVTWIFPRLKWLSLVDCVEDFGQLMEAQVNLYVEARNLEQFAVNFDSVESVRFPKPLWHLVRPYILVETYEEGVPVQHYVTDRSSRQFNAKLAELGIDTILKMVFEDNFAHGDLHPGNILVRETESNDTKQKKSWYTMPFLIFKSRPYPVSIVILDCGIIASLDDRGKRCLKGVFKAVACGDGDKVGELFLNHSVHQCTNPESFKHRMNEIIDVSTLMTSLFSAMIEHRVKLDGSFSSIILALMVVEGLGRSLDPTLDIVQKAKPFLVTCV